MADGVNKIITPFIPVERATERGDKRDKRNQDRFLRSPERAKKEKEPSTPAAAEEGEKRKGGLVDIKA